MQFSLMPSSKYLFFGSINFSFIALGVGQVFGREVLSVTIEITTLPVLILS